MKEKTWRNYLLVSEIFMFMTLAVCGTLTQTHWLSLTPQKTLLVQTKTKFCILKTLKENALAEVKLKQQLQADDEVYIDIWWNNNKTISAELFPRSSLSIWQD